MIGTMQKMGKSCVYSPSNKDEFEKIINTFPHTALLMRWEKCPHCHALLGDFEQECVKMGKNSPVAMIECEVGNEWCQSAWKDAKPSNIRPEDYGVPVVIGLNKGGKPSEPSWLIHGQKPDELRIIMGKLKKSIDENRAQIGGNQPQSMTQNTPSQEPQRVASNSAYVANLISGSFGVKSVKSGNNGGLCVTGISCDKNTFNQRIKEFLLS